MVELKSLRKQTVLRPPKLLIYGTPGIGKSSFASSNPDCIFLDIEDGLDGMEVTRYPAATYQNGANRYVFKSYEEIMNALNELYKQEHDFKAVAIDTVDWMEKLIWARVCQEWNVDNIEKVDKGFQRGYKYSIGYWQQIMAGLTALRDHRNMTIILLGHCKVDKFDDPMGDAYNFYNLDLHKEAAATLVEWCDAVFFADQKIMTTKKEDLGFNRSSTKVTGMDRILYTSEQPQHKAKNRYGLPAEIKMDPKDPWGKFMSVLNTCLSKGGTANREPEPVVQEAPKEELPPPVDASAFEQPPELPAAEPAVETQTPTE